MSVDLEEVSLTKVEFWRFLPPLLPQQHISRNSEVSKLFRRVCSASQGSVTTIAGRENMSGCGKSTLAASLMSHPEATSFFTGGKYWFYVGELYDENEILGVMKLFCLMFVRCVRHSFEDRSILFDICSELEHIDSPEEVSLLLRDIYAYNNEEGVRPTLLVIDDVWNDRVVRLLRSVGCTLLITTRWPELFSEGQFPGSVFFTEPSGADIQQFVENKFKLSRLQRLIDVCKSHVMCLSLLQRIVASIQTSERLQQFLSGVYYHKAHNEWILRHGCDDFVSVDVRKHMLSFMLLSAATDLLQSSTQCYYLMLVLLPRSYAITPSFLQYYWRAESLEMVTRIVNRLLDVGLINVKGAGHSVSYVLHTIHYEFLSLLTLRLHDQQASIETPWCGKTRVDDILLGTAHRFKMLLTSHTHVLAGHQPSLFEYFIFWKRMNSLATLKVIPPFNPLVCYQEEILRMIRCNPDALMRYLEAICYISDGLSLWQRDGATLVLWYKMLYDYYHRGVVSQVSLRRQAGVLNRLGTLHRHMGNNRDALEVHMQALMVYQSMPGSDISKEKDVCYTLGCMAEVYVSSNKREDATKLLDSLLKYKFELFNGKHPSIGDLYSRLGDINMMNGCCSEAKVYYSCAYDIYALCLGQNHFTTVQSKAVLGGAYITEGECEEGSKFIQEAITWLLSHGYAWDHPLVNKYSKLLSYHQSQKSTITLGVRNFLLCVSNSE